MSCWLYGYKAYIPSTKTKFIYQSTTNIITLLGVVLNDTKSQEL